MSLNESLKCKVLKFETMTWSVNLKYLETKGDRESLTESVKCKNRSQNMTIKCIYSIVNVHSTAISVIYSSFFKLRHRWTIIHIEDVVRKRKTLKYPQLFSLP